jgi:hypothetical protein
MRPVYASTNFGISWAQTSAPTNNWFSVASSADGSRLTAAIDGGAIYTSADSGSTWTSNNVPSNHWSSVASSADGGKLAAVSSGGIYTSQTTPPPVLNAKPSGSNLALSWIVPSTNYVVQQITNLTAGNWSVLPVTPTFNLTNLQNQVFLPLSSGNRFYRLKTQ